jgi:hypothetical protein
VPTASDSTVFTYAGGTFIHSNGTLRFRAAAIYNAEASSTFTISLASALTVNNLQYEAGTSAVSYDADRRWTLSGDAAKFVVLGNFTMQRATGFTLAGNQTARPIANGGTIELRGNLNIGTGSYAGSTVIKVNGTGTQTYTYSGGTAPPIEIDKSAGAISAATGTTDLETISFTLTQGTFNAPSGNLTIFPMTASNSTVFIYTGGTFNHSNGTLRFRALALYNAEANTTFTISLASALTVNNLQYEAGTSSVGYDADRLWSLSGAAAKFVVLGDFTMRRATGFSLAASQTAQPVANGGTIELRGNLI